MATLYTVLCALQSAVSSITTGLVSNSPDTLGLPLDVRVGLYWPSAKSLQDNVRKANGTGGPSALVTVYDRGMAQDSTRWLPTVVSSSITTNPPDPTQHMSVVASEIAVQQLATMTLTFSGPVQVGDAVGIVLTGVLGTLSAAVVPIAVAGDDATSMAAKAAALLTADPLISTWMTAVASGPVVTLTSLLPTSFIALTLNVGAGTGTADGSSGTRVREIGRRKRHFQIVVWTRTPDDRITVGDPIEAWIAEREADFGLTFSDGTMGRLTFYADVQHDEAVLSDAYRRDFMCCLDYGINVTDITYSILAPISQNTIF